MSSNADKRSSIITPSLISKTDLTLKDVIGRGHYGVVLKSTWKHRDGIEIECAVKVLTQSPEKLVQEIVHMQKLSHENIVQLYGVCLEEPVLMVLELCDGGSLAARLKDHSKPTPLVTTLLKYAIQIAEGMRYLETQGYVHRDLAARNVLLTKDEQTAKIADFGLTRHLEPDQSLYEMSQNAQLPFSWCPPESLRYKKFSSQSDVWAFGVTIWEMFQYEKEDPWMNLSSRMVLEKIEAGERLSKPLYCPQEIYKIMLECWDFVPQARPNFTILTNKLKGFEFDVFDLDKKEKSAYEAPIGSPHSNKFIIVDYDDLDNIIAQNVSSGKFCKFSPDGELTEIENNDTSLLPPVQPRTSSSRTDTTLFPPIQRRTSSSRTDSTFSAHKPPVVKKPTFLSEHKITNEYSTSFPKNFHAQPVPTAPYDNERTSTPPLPTRANDSNKISWVSHLREFWSRIVEHRKWLIIILICTIVIISLIIIIVVLVTRHHQTKQESTTAPTIIFVTNNPYVFPSSQSPKTPLTQQTTQALPNPSTSIQNNYTNPIIQTTQAISTSSCPNSSWHYLFRNKKCYYLGLESSNWNDSLTACQNLYPGATLVSIHSYYENNQLIYWFNSSGDSIHYYLNIGLRKLQSFDDYTWADGSVVDFSLMAKSQSNNGLCVYMNPTYYDPDEQGYGYWYPAICDLSFIQNYGYFCELQLTSPPPTQSPFQCGVGWVYYNLYCYKMYNQELDFYSASSFCLNIGANLVSIQNNDENNFLDAFSGMSSTKMTWIGLQYVSQQWIWTNGTIANYMNWVQNGPYDPYSHPCGFIFLYYSSNNAAYLQWGNDVCSSLYTFICKTPATV